MKLLNMLLATALLSTSINSLATQLLREPDISGDKLVFAYANDIWTASINGGKAKRLTSFQGREYLPKFSPDGELIAFTGQYAGNNDVFIVNAGGGEVRRLTYHPGNDELVGFTPDGESVLFRSTRSNAPRGWDRLYTVSIDGGNPKRLPMNRAYDGAFSPNAEALVFRRPGYWDKGWRNYRGGQNQALRIIDLDSLEERDLPFNNDFDIDPAWEGDLIYFLSNRSQVSNVFAYNVKSNAVTQITQSKDFDVMSFAVDAENLVYEYLGDLYLKRDTNAPVKLNITIDDNFYWLREQYVDASKTIASFDISPSAKRAVFEARGDIFTVPVEHGSPRNLTDTSGVREVSPAWSPNGDTIAYFSDASGEYRLVFADQFGVVKQEIELAESGFYQALSWSPDASRVIFTDQLQRLWIVNVDNASSRIIDQNTTTHVEPELMASWSPDSKWVAYTTQNQTMFRELHLYSVEKRESYQISDGLAEIQYPVWDADGNKLYFVASTNYGPKAAWLDMSTLAFDPSYHLYYALLSDKAESPLPLRSDEEAANDEASIEIESNDEASDKKDESKDAVTVTVTLAGLSNRILPLMAEEGHFSHVKTGKAGTVFYLSRYNDGAGKTQSDLYRFTLEDRASKKIASSVQNYRISADGESILAQTDSGWRVFAAAGESSADDKMLSMNLQKRVNFAQEWQQIFREAWRYQRDYLYVDNFHGADWDKVYKAYQPLVASVSHPADLTYLLDAMGAEVSIGHSYTSFGELPDIDDNQIGLLGVDFDIDTEGRDKGVKFAKIYSGESFFPSENASAPLAHIAHLIPEGSYLLEVNGKAVDANSNIYQYFEGTLGKHTRIKIGASANDDDAKIHLVKPIASDVALRRNDWVEANRKYVDEKSEGKLAYVWVPDTAMGGYTSFNRYFFAQSDKQGVIIDERFNHGGFIANYIIDVLRRELNGFFNNPFNQAQPMTSPGSGIWGNQVMLINEVSGSGGDMLPYMFRFYELGPLIGKRTWGGLVGIWGVPPLIDGGYITAPRSGFYDLNGEWKVENEGVAPDIVVEQLTKLTAKGIDPQLDRAIEEAMKGIDDNKELIKPQPAPPIRVPMVN
uniref:S41 family peptidase n=1 Tax=Ningiella ruwaisensis TaxID=2364274 RepID=UPI0010A02F4E|nr:S41 family peptidase [Ningiella ruwaisensis]